MLRSLFKTLAKDYSSDGRSPHYNHSNNTELITIGRLKGGSGRPSKATIVADNDSNQDLDSESTRNIITVTREFETHTDQNGEELTQTVGRTNAYVFGHGGNNHLKS